LFQFVTFEDIKLYAFIKVY